MLAALVRFAAPVAAEDFDTEEYRRQQGLALIQAAGAYEQGYTGLGVTIGIFDSGLNGPHPEFAGQLLGGYDFAREMFITADNAVDPVGHGSHVAGLAVARRDGVGMHGVAFDAQMVLAAAAPARATDDIQFAEGFDFLDRARVPIVNASLRLREDPLNHTPATVQARYPQLLSSLRSLGEHDSLVVVATGNDSMLHPDLLPAMPAFAPELSSHWLAVTAVGLDGAPVPYANHCGMVKDVCLTAPGGSDARPAYSVAGTGTGYRDDVGTSMAAPQVSGAAALVRQAFPFFSASNLQQTLLTTATPLDGQRISEQYGWGLLNAAKAVRGPAEFVREFAVDTQGQDAVFSNDISGVGGLTKSGAGTLTLTGTHTYTGATMVRGGGLRVDANLASTVFVSPQATLAGNGRLGGLDQSGTVLGGLVIAGDYVSRPGSMLMLDTDAGQTLSVQGRARLLGGTVTSISNGPYRVGASLPIVQADAGLSGSYDTVKLVRRGWGDLPFLAGALVAVPSSSGGQGLAVQVRRSALPYAAVLSTPAQRAVGNALDQATGRYTSALLPLQDALVHAQLAELAPMMQQLTGQVHASAGSTAWTPSRLLAQAMQAQARQDKLTGAREPLWAAVVAYGDAMAGGGAAHVHNRYGGLHLGARLAATGRWQVGVAAGLLRGRTELDQDQGSARSDNYALGIYGQGSGMLTGTQGWSLTGSAVYARQYYETQRSIQLLGSQQLKADYPMDVLHMQVQGHLAFALGGTAVAGPYAGVAWQWRRQPGYEEHGGVLALAGEDQSDTLAYASLGLRGSVRLGSDADSASLTASAGWQHASAAEQSRRLAFVQDRAIAFDAPGVPLARDTLALDVQAAWAYGRYSALRIRYAGRLGGGSASHAASLGLNVAF